MGLLENINSANDIKNIEPENYEELAQEIREFLVDKVSKTGGHLASNLGAVELTMALHIVFDMPEDKIIWDVGHQSYVHKLLTGRKDGFDTLRQKDGLSGFPKRSESECDAFNTGHATTSISAGLGFARARDILGEDYSVVSVIGDGSFTGGMAFEGLNNASEIKSNFIIVLNDNDMSISHNVGGLSKHLSSLRTTAAYRNIKMGVHESIDKLPNGERLTERIRRTKSSFKQLFIPGMIFENMSITYLGPIDGHDTEAIIRVLNDARKVQGPVVVHVATKKGKGYIPAEIHPDKFHGIGTFDPETGKANKKKEEPDYTDVFASVVSKIAAKNPNFVCITAAMDEGTGLKKFSAEYPDRFFDVGIAEEHAVTFAAGLAAAGLKPCFAVYSSFLQRGYDQLVHDVCMQKLPVIFAVDRAGIVGADGDTHQGLLDLSYLSSIPGMTVMAPKNRWELADMMWFAQRFDGPIAVRYPRGTSYSGLKEFREPIQLGKSEMIYEGKDIALLPVGNMVETAVKVRELLAEKGIDATLVNARFVKPIDTEMIEKLCENHKLIVTMEENVLNGGFGSLVESFINTLDTETNILRIGINDQFVQHGSPDQLRKMLGLDAISVTENIINFIKE